MTHKLFFLCSLLIGGSLFAQSYTEDISRLKIYSDSIRNSGSDDVKRTLYSDSFVLLMKEVMDTEDPFSVSLDSLKHVLSVLDDKDGKVRVITWMIANSREEYTNYGVVLYRKSKRSDAKVFWLKDYIEQGIDSLYNDF